MAKSPSESVEPSGIVDLVRAVAPGLSLGKIFGEIADELAHQGRQGSHELAAALLRGHDGFVLYPREGREADGRGVHGEAKSVEAGGPEREPDGLER